MAYPADTVVETAILTVENVLVEDLKFMYTFLLVRIAILVLFVWIFLRLSFLFSPAPRVAGPPSAAC